PPRPVFLPRPTTALYSPSPCLSAPRMPFLRLLVHLFSRQSHPAVGLACHRVTQHHHLSATARDTAGRLGHCRRAQPIISVALSRSHRAAERRQSIHTRAWVAVVALERGHSSYATGDATAIADSNRRFDRRAQQRFFYCVHL